MKNNRHFWTVLLFIGLSVAPFVPVAISFAKIRNSILFDQPISWVEGQEAKFTIPALPKGLYELRLESTVSDWQPMVKVAWALREKESSKEIMGSSEAQEIILTRPVAKIQILEMTPGENELTVSFANANPTDRNLRVKLGQDRSALIEDSTHDFGIVLAVSLVLMLLFWKPLARVKPQPNS